MQRAIVSTILNPPVCLSKKNPKLLISIQKIFPLLPFSNVVDLQLKK